MEDIIITIRRLFNKRIMMMMAILLVIISILSLIMLNSKGVSNEVLESYGGLFNMLMFLLILDVGTILLVVFGVLWIFRENEGLINFFNKDKQVK